VGRSHEMQSNLTQITRNLLLKCAFVRSRRKFGHSTRFPQEVCGHIHLQERHGNAIGSTPAPALNEVPGQSQMTSISEVPTRLGVQFDEGRSSNAKSIG
jgi:hypothetical protein